MIGRWLWLFLSAALLLAAATAERDRVFVGGQIYFVDADCYARMTRAAQAISHPFQRIAHHDFENFPAGADVHTTAPLDWLIALLSLAFLPFGSRAIDLAGAWISPLLGVATLVVLWVWSARTRLPYSPAMLLLIAASPIVAQAFRLGRPDHQSLLLALLAMALAAKWSLWQRPTRNAAIASGIAWGLALWTSLYEPLVLLALMVILRFAFLRRGAFTRSWALATGAAAGVFLLGVGIDGWRVSAPSPEVAQYFPNWSRSIGELAHLPPLSPQFAGWLGWLAPALPFLLVWQFRKSREPRLLALLVLALATYGLTCWQIRWGCYLALVFAIALPFALAAIPSRITAWTLFALSLLPLASQWDAMLYPNESAREAIEEQRADYQLLRQTALALVSGERTGILAPWWLSPPLAYWSGQPCVAGSSHESLPGTVDTARFYMATDDRAAREILRRRDVRYVVAYEPSRVLGTAAQLLGEPARPGSLGAILYDTPALAPPWLEMVYSNAFFKVYEVKRDGI